MRKVSIENARRHQLRLEATGSRLVLIGGGVTRLNTGANEYEMIH